MEKLLLRHQRAPGDVVVMSALIRDLALSYPGRFHIAVDTSFRELWENNPYVKIMRDKSGARVVNLTYGEYIRKAGTEKIHFISAFHKDLKKQTGISVPMLYPYPDLHLSEEEKKPFIGERYWVVLAGGKNDFTTKHWVYDRYQQVIDTLSNFGIKIVQIGGKGSHPTHSHPKLKNVLDLVGETSIRQMIRIISQADGVICTITAAMHMAAALNKPCVVTGAGREEWWWEGYHKDNPAMQEFKNPITTSHKYLHTIGLLDCCSKKGCWKNKVQKSEGDKSFCHYPVVAEGAQTVPMCMDLISVDKVVSSVLSYYMDGTLPLLEGMVLPDATKAVTFDLNKQRYALTMRLANSEQELANISYVFGEKATQLANKEEILKNIANENEQRLNNSINLPKNIQNTATKEVDLIKTHIVNPGTRLVDSQQIGGKITFCVLLYGNFADMHARCLKAIQNTTNRNDVDLRVYCNNVCEATKELCKAMFNNGIISVIYESSTNKYKYPCMREMFHDEKFPITTKWVVWFDDDTMCDVDAIWFDKMCSAINSAAITDSNFGMLGPIYHFAMQPKHAEWVKKADWYRSKHFRDRIGKPTVNGNKIFFTTGSFWAMKAEAIQKANVPDLRLSHNGGDICIGEQMWQNGYTLKNWNGDKKIVCWSSTARRGANQPIFNI
jgi:ADP-heptose:LPS heptosyltransferase